MAGMERSMNRFGPRRLSLFSSLQDDVRAWKCPKRETIYRYNSATRPLLLMPMIFCWAFCLFGSSCALASSRIRRPGVYTYRNIQAVAYIIHAVCRTHSEICYHDDSFFCWASLLLARPTLFGPRHVKEGTVRFRERNNRCVSVFAMSGVSSFILEIYS